MTDFTTTLSLGTVWIPAEAAWDMFKRGQLPGMEVTVELTAGMVKAELTVVGRRQPVYVARDEYERLTGRSSDGWERFHDALINKPIEARVNGQLVLRKDLDAVLDVAGPAEAVTKARELLAKIDAGAKAAPAVQMLHG